MRTLPVVISGTGRMLLVNGRHRSVPRLQGVLQPLQRYDKVIRLRPEDREIGPRPDLSQMTRTGAIPRVV